MSMEHQIATFLIAFTLFFVVSSTLVFMATASSGGRWYHYAIFSLVPAFFFAIGAAIL